MSQELSVTFSIGFGRVKQVLFEENTRSHHKNCSAPILLNFHSVFAEFLFSLSFKQNFDLMWRLFFWCVFSKILLGNKLIVTTPSLFVFHLLCLISYICQKEYNIYYGSSTSCRSVHRPASRLSCFFPSFLLAGCSWAHPLWALIEPTHDLHEISWLMDP